MNNFQKYCIFVAPDLLRTRPQLLEVAGALQRWWDNGKTGDVLNISMPTRFGKSFLSSAFSAWLLLRDADTRVLRATYAAELSESFSLQVRAQYIDFFERCGQQLPAIEGTRSRWSIDGRTYPNHIAVGIGGGITGFGCDIAIIDDTAKNMIEATSAANQRTLQSFRESVLLGRLEGRRKILNVGTRWCVNDWFSLFPDADNIVYPAMNDDGTSICEEWKTTEELKIDKQRVSAEVWSAQYQQQPTAEGRRRLFENWCAKIEDRTAGDNVIAVIDPATDYGRDWYVIGLYEYIDGFVVLHNMWHQSAASPETAADWLRRQKYRVAYIEANGAGRNIADKMRATGVRNLVGFTTKRDKYSRAYVQAEAIFNYFRVSADCDPSALEELTREARAFPVEGGNIHDDLIDNVVMAFERIIKK